MRLRQHVLTSFKLAIPVSLGQLGHIFTQLADSIMLGKYDPLHLAASTLGFNLIIPFLLFGIGFSMSLSPVTAQSLGSQNKLRIAIYLKNAFSLFIIIGVLLVVLLQLIKPVIYHLDQKEAIIPLAIDYYEIVAYSVGLVMIFQIFRQFSEGLAETKIPMYISLLGNGLNIIGNYLLIYGVGFFPELGLKGAALSTLLSRLIMVLAALLLLYYHPKYREYTRTALLVSFKKVYQYKLMQLGLPIGIQYIIEVTSFAVVVIFIGWMGETELVAHNIGMNIASLSFIIGTGFGAATTIRVGNYLGRKDIENLKKAGNAGFLLTLSWFSFSALLFILLKNELPKIYVDHDEIDIITQAAGVILIAGFFQFSDGVQMLSLSILRGLNDVNIPAFMSFLAYWVIGIPIGYLLAFDKNMGLNGIWYGLVIGLSFSALFLIFRLTFKLKKLPHG